MKYKTLEEVIAGTSRTLLLNWFAYGKDAEDWIVENVDFNGLSDEEKETLHQQIRIEMITHLTENLLAEEFPYAILKQMGATSQDMQDASAYITGQQVAIDLSLIAGEWLDGRHNPDPQEHTEIPTPKPKGKRKYLIAGLAIGAITAAAVTYCLTRSDK